MGMTTARHSQTRSGPWVSLCIQSKPDSDKAVLWLNLKVCASGLGFHFRLGYFVVLSIPVDHCLAAGLVGGFWLQVSILPRIDMPNPQPVVCPCAN